MHVRITLNGKIWLWLLPIVVIGGCQRPKAHVQVSQVSFGYQPFGSNLPFFVAMEKDFFGEQGVKVVPQKIISANDAANAVVNGSIVGNATVPLNVLLNIEENQPGLMKIFMVKTTSKQVWSDYLLVKKGSKIKSIAQLKGKKVGGYPGSAQQSQSHNASGTIRHAMLSRQTIDADDSRQGKEESG